MRVVIFCHSLVSDWNHGNAHFLRGISTELLARGHEVDVYEPRDGWSRSNLRRSQGEKPEREFAEAFPMLSSQEYTLTELDLDQVLDRADLVLVHEWNEPELIRRIGEHHERTGGYRLLFHDTHHRAVTAPDEMRRFDLSGFDGVLAFGEVIRQLYLERDWAARATPARAAATIWSGSATGETTSAARSYARCCSNPRAICT
jgi:spore maturation protein CgeB